MAWQVTTVPVAVSFSAGLLAFPVMDPPGFTVQVVTVLAPDDAAPRLTVRATAAVASSPLPMSFLMRIRSSSACYPAAPGWRARGGRLVTRHRRCQFWRVLMSGAGDGLPRRD